MAVWNDFLHARLHFHPEEAYELLKYQKHITDFSKLYKFEAKILVLFEMAFPTKDAQLSWSCVFIKPDVALALLH